MGAEGIDVDVFDRDPQGREAVLAAAALGLSHPLPVGGSVAGAPESVAVHERFHQVNRVAVFGPPVRAQLAEDHPENVAGQMRDHDPGENEKPGIVGQEAEVALPLLITPADKGVARRELPGGGAEEHTREIAAIRIAHQVFEVLAHRAMKAQVMMLGEVGTKAPVLRGAKFRKQEGEGGECCQGGSNRNGRRDRRQYVAGHRPGHAAHGGADGGQRHEPSLLQLEQQTASRVIFQLPGGGAPIPLPA